MAIGGARNSAVRDNVPSGRERYVNEPVCVFSFVFRSASLRRRAISFGDGGRGAKDAGRGAGGGGRGCTGTKGVAGAEGAEGAEGAGTGSAGGGDAGVAAAATIGFSSFGGVFSATATSACLDGLSTSFGRATDASARASGVDIVPVTCPQSGSPYSWP